jgi:hypothetical protein
MKDKTIKGALFAGLKTITIIAGIVIFPFIVFIVVMLWGASPKTTETVISNQNGNKIIVEHTVSGFINVRYIAKGYVEDEVTGIRIEVFSTNYNTVLYRVTNNIVVFYVYSATNPSVKFRDFQSCSVNFVEHSLFNSMMDSNDSSVKKFSIYNSGN